MHELIKIVLLAMPAIMLVTAFALNSRQRVEAQEHVARRKGERITP